MGVNKVDLANGETLIDLQNDTVTPETLAKGKTAHNAQGEQIVGEMEQTVAKEEIEINVPTITQNGHYELTAPEGKVISKATVEVAVPTQGGGSGIIEVPELPTENIDENAVYKVVSNQEQQVYVIMGGQVYTAEQYAASSGMGCYIYYVDELPSVLKETRTDLHLYVLSSNGIGYIAFMSSTNIQQIGAVLGLVDRGYTDNISFENLDGVYVTKKGEETWFIRENGEWKQISPNKYKATVELFKYGESILKPEEGKLFSEVAVVVKAPSTGDIIDKVLEEVTEEYFIKSNGECCYFLKKFPFSGMTSLKKATIAEGVRNISRAFEDCTNLETVTFKGIPLSCDNDVFSNCPALTTINVPWSYGAVKNAPWGATNATINYNYTGE